MAVPTKNGTRKGKQTKRAALPPHSSSWELPRSPLVNSLHAKSVHNYRLHSGKRSNDEPVYIPHQHLDIVHRQMLREAMERNALHPRRSLKRKQEKRQRRLMRVPALLMVKLGRRLEGFGQAYLEDRQRCSA